MLKGRLLLELLLVVQQRETHREFAVEHHVIIVQDITLGAELIEHEFERAAALESRRTNRRVDDARGAAEAEQDGVGSALQIDATDVVSIPRNIREEEVAGVVGRHQAADARVTVGVRKRSEFVDVAFVAAAIGAREIAARTGDFGVHGIGQDRLVIVSSKVVDQLLGED